MGLSILVILLYALASARRARACIKYPQLNTWISILFQRKSPSRKPSWIASSLNWMKKWEMELLLESVSDRERGIRNDGRRASMVVLNHVWIRMENQKAFKASRMYIENGYKETT